MVSAVTVARHMRKAAAATAAAVRECKREGLSCQVTNFEWLDDFGVWTGGIPPENTTVLIDFAGSFLNQTFAEFYSGIPYRMSKKSKDRLRDPAL